MFNDNDKVMRRVEALLFVPAAPLLYLLIRSVAARLVTADAAEYASWVTVISSAATLACGLIFCAVRRRSFFGEIGARRMDAAAFVLCLMLGVSSNMLLSGLMAVIPIPESLTSQYENSAATVMSGKNVVFTVIAVGLLVPIAEEVVFRGFVMNMLRRGFGTAAAIIGSAVIFAVMHMIPLQIAFVLPVGLLIALVMHRTRSIFGAMAVHIGFNTTTAVAASFAAQAGAVAAPDAELAAQAGAYLAGAGFAASALLVYFIWKRCGRTAAPAEVNDVVESA